MRLLAILCASCAVNPQDINASLGDASIDDLARAETADFAAPDLAAADFAGADFAAVDLSGVSVVCGSQRCRADQVCVSGECQFTCSGVTVPGMFATVKDAANSLPATGGTICVGDGASLDQTFTFDRSLTIIGVSAARSASAAPVTVTAASTRPSGMPATLILKGLGFNAGLILQGNSPLTDQIELVASTVGASVNGELGLILFPFAAHIILDGDDLSTNVSNAAVTVEGHLVTGANPKVTIQNCFIHDSGTGFSDQSADSAPTITVVNNTFLNNGVPFIGQVATTTGVAANNLFASSGPDPSGIDVGGGATWSLHNNGYFNQQDNNPPPGASDVTADPLLDAQRPPALGAGSPCRGAGDSSVAPATDFFGRVRGSAVDIGARQDP